jgi:uncharacterized coiled-coil DUF342 family protein
MAYKKPEEKVCNILYLDRAVDDFVNGIYNGYNTENTLNEMIRRSSNGGLLGLEKAKIKLLKAALPKLNNHIDEFQKDLSNIVLRLEEDVVSDANSIRNGTSHFNFDYESEVKAIENIKYEMNKFERSLNDSSYLIKQLEKQSQQNI